MAFEKIFDILKRAGVQYPALQQKISEAEAFAQWDKAVGPIISKHARPIRVQEGTLCVEVDHPAWQSELHHRKSQILSALNKDQSRPLIRDLLFYSSRKTKT